MYHCGQLQGFVPIIGGIYGWCMATGKVGGDSDKMQLWRRKFGKTMRILVSIVVVFGILQLLGIFN